jgi:methionine synthase II (cobalamin-independent)
MRRSDERILTTHAGSLARPEALRALLTAKDEGQPYDAAALALQTRAAVAGVVRDQMGVGLDVVNDGKAVEAGIANFRAALAGVEVVEAFAWAKFEALVEGAGLATRQLWGR